MNSWYSTPKTVDGGVAEACIASVESAGSVQDRARPEPPRCNLSAETINKIRRMWDAGRTIRAVAIELKIELWQIRAATPGMVW